MIVLFLAIVVLFPLLLVGPTFVLLAALWVRGLLGGAPVSIVQILGMRLRGVPPRLIIDSIIALIHRGYRYDPIMFYQAESLYLAQRELIQSPEQLADLTAKFFKTDGPG